MSTINKVPKAFKVLKEAIQEDSSYAWSWHCNIAMAYQDSGGDRTTSNIAAARFIKQLFDVDVTKFKEWNP